MTARPAVVGALPHAPGVYRFRDARDRVIYLGRATDLRSRVGSYWGELTDRRHLRRMVPQIARVEAVECDSAHEAAWLERNLLERSKPRWNRIRGGTEVPVWITLTRRSGTARLDVVHENDVPGATTFGPFLGGGQARLAVAGIDRALALSYAGHPRGGFDREMARMRGVHRIDLERVVARACAALAREPDAVEAVLGELVRRREAASGACAYEVAAHIQLEIEAVTWVTAPQKVRVSEDVDRTVAGWCDGTLVTFGIRGGRLYRWCQSSADATRAGPLIEQTADEWRPFADRAAALAVRLLRT